MQKGTPVTEERFEQCIRRMNQGEQDALREVYEEYISYIYHIVLNVLHNRENAEDITSEFFIRLWEKSDTYRSGNGHRGWMAAIARNMSVDFLRRHKREELTDTFDESIGQNVVEEPVLGEMLIEDALSRLDEASRGIVHLKIVGQLTFKEIAEVLHMPMGTVTWKYQEAIKRLRRCGYE